MRTTRLLLAGSLTMLIACTAPAHVDRRADPPVRAHDVLILGTSSGTALLDGATERVFVPQAGEVTSPDGSLLYAAIADGTRTRVETRDSFSGDVLTPSNIRHTTVDGRWRVTAASISGRALVLMRPHPYGLDDTVALPRARTPLVVVDPTGELAIRRFALRGNYEPEAFSIDDTRLFMIQYLPALAPSSYRVTSLDLTTGRVRAVYGRFRSPPERMPGTRLAQVFGLASEQLYTLYSNQPAEHFHDHWQDARPTDREVSFIHVLNLRKGWAYCAGLPRELWGRPEGTQAIVATPNGRSVFVVDPGQGLIAEMDTRSLKITRTAKIELGAGRDASVSAVMSPDGHTLYVDAGGGFVARVDVGDLRVLGRWEIQGTATGLGLSADGLRLYASLLDRIVVVDTTSGIAEPIGVSISDGASILRVRTA